MGIRGKNYERLREVIAKIPVIDCHDHSSGPQHALKLTEPIAALIQCYLPGDFVSAGAEKETAMFLDQAVPTEKKWPKFRNFWQKMEHTGYAKVIKTVMRNMFGEERMTLAALKRIAKSLPDLTDAKVYFGILKEAGIHCRLVNIYPDIKAYIQGKYLLPKCDRMMIPLPEFHAPVRSYDGIQKIAGYLDRKVVELDEFLECCRDIFIAMKKRGAIGMKDQSAYSRPIEFDNVAHADAERLFNFIMEDPRRSVGWPEVKPLDDYLFQSFMRMARDLDLAVQIHSGGMAGNYNEIAKNNAVLMTPVFELHRDVRFDLIHANWPNAGEMLFLLKNFPNVHMGLCWTYLIDAYYSRHILCEALTVAPHSKIHGFGGDFFDLPNYSAAHLEIARDTIAEALAEMIDRQWIDFDEAKQIAADWLFNNPNKFYNLGFKAFGVS